MKVDLKEKEDMKSLIQKPIRVVLTPFGSANYSRRTVAVPSA
jgi:hypothetical protein